MVFQFMLHLIFQKNKLKATPVTVEGLIDLVSQQVLLVADWVSGHLQAENTQQEAGVSVEAGKVLENIRVEGRAIGAHLADVGHLSRFVVGLHVVQEGRLILKCPLTYTTHTGGEDGAMHLLLVALQLSWR